MILKTYNRVKKSLFYIIKGIFKTTINKNGVPNAVAPKYRLYRNDSSELQKDIPKIIWVYWEGKNDLPIVDACLKSIEKNKGDFELRILNRQNLNKYIQLENNKFTYDKPAFFADHIRLLLLKEYGGIWLDATTILTQTLDWLLDITKSNNVSFACDYNPNMEIGNGIPYLENFFLASSPNNEFISDLLWQFEDWLQSENKPNYFRKREDYQNIKQKIEGDGEKYLNCYMCMQIILNEKKYNFLCFNTLENCLYYDLIDNGNHFLFGDNLLMKKKPDSPSRIIKITSHHRNYFSYYIRFNCVVKNSILGQYIR